MSYVVSLLWLLLLLLTTAEAVRAHIWTTAPVHAASLFFQPWPVADPRQLLAWPGSRSACCCCPSCCRWCWRCPSGARRRAFGGGRRLLRDRGGRALLSVLLAPVLMVQHSKAVLGILLGRGVAWTTQQRDGETETWTAVTLSYGDITLLGALWAGVAYLVAPELHVLARPGARGLPAGDSARGALGSGRSRRCHASERLVPDPRGIAPPPELTDLCRGPARERAISPTPTPALAAATGRRAEIA